MSSAYDGRQYVGIDLHRRRSVVARMNAEGEVLSCANIPNDPQLFAEQLAAAGESPEVVLEATYGWYWLADLLAEHGGRVHLAHVLGIKGMSSRRVKNDQRDATDLADLLRMGRLPEAYIAPPQVRELRELVRYRFKMVALRSGLKSQVHAVLAKEGIAVGMSDLFGVQGRHFLSTLPLGAVYRRRVLSLCRLIDDISREVTWVETTLRARLRRHQGYQALQTIPGIGETFAAVFVAEIGDVGRFRNARQLACWAGLTPKHYESDVKVRRGHISKQGSALVRWAAVEACQRTRDGLPELTRRRDAIAERRRSVNLAKVAMARRMMHLVFYALRDGQVRSLRALQAA